MPEWPRTVWHRDPEIAETVADDTLAALKAQAAPDGPMVTRPESEGSDPWAQSGESLLDQGAGS